MVIRLGEHEACLADCAIAIYAQDDCKSAWLSKTSALVRKHVSFSTHTLPDVSAFCFVTRIRSVSR